MRRLALQCLCLIALCACVPIAHAQIYRCIGAHGEPVFSGQPCGPPAPPAGAGAMSQGGFANVCAGSPRDVAQYINDAFQSHDVNLLAGLIVWRGIGQTGARTTLRALSAWLKQPLGAITLVGGVGPPPAASTPTPEEAGVDSADGVVVLPPPPPPAGVRVSTGGGGGSTRYFGLTRSSGCWWLTF